MKAFYQADLNFNQLKLRHNLQYKLHFHHQVELVYMFKGTGCVIIDGREYSLRAGDVVIVFPNQFHEYKAGEGEEFFITIFKPEILPDFKDLFFGFVPENCVYSTNEEDRLLHDIAVELLSDSFKEHKYKDQLYRGLLTAFFAEFFTRITLKKAEYADVFVLKSMMTYCNENYLNDIKLGDVAKALHVSKYYVSHLLNTKLRISFNDYINSLRIADAVVLLEDGRYGITEIAQKTGFNTARTFNRAFKSVYGVSPSQYKKSPF